MSVQVADIEGQDFYKVFGLSRFARLDDIKRVRPFLSWIRSRSLPSRLRNASFWVQAYKELARRLHPDKGGDARSFGILQTAYETLSDARKRAVYDEWAKDLRFRYVEDHKTKASWHSPLSVLARSLLSAKSCLLPLCPRYLLHHCNPPKLSWLADSWQRERSAGRAQQAGSGL